MSADLGDCSSRRKVNGSHRFFSVSCLRFVTAFSIVFPFFESLIKASFVCVVARLLVFAASKLDIIVSRGLENGLP